ncbi:MAG: flagellar motor switch protein FliN [Deferribacteraceae bacterium]|jgi:flagellar motor switch protein FliN/FliY|nr:flagellar motor switch protein FliN [Deferribacteraceae bacterium]
MREAIDFEREPGLKKFCGIVTDVLNSNLQAITNAPLNINILETVHCTPDDLINGYMNGVIIAASEVKTELEIGLLFNMKDITILADMMMMGEGESRNDLDDELKDAVVEIGNQFFGGLSVPVETQMGKKLQFKTDDASKLQNTNSFQSDKYIAVDMQGELKGATLQCRLYIDEGFSSLIETQSEKPASAPDFFGQSPEPARQTAVISPNLEMLMDIEIPISVRMGSAQLFLKDILGLGPGNIVELDQNADESIELVVNDKVIAKGEVVIIDGYFGFRIKEIISKAERIKRLKD